MQQSYSITERQGLWSADADIQASLAIGRAALEGLACLAPCLKAEHGADMSEVLAAAARCDRAATQRISDILQEMRDRLQGALAQARMEGDLERAIIAAAARLPDSHLAANSQPLRAAG